MFTTETAPRLSLGTTRASSRYRFINAIIIGAVKPPSDIDVDLEDGTEDPEYIEKLNCACSKALNLFDPQLVMYVAGADPYKEDLWGELRLTIEGLAERDRLVFGAARRYGLPMASTFAGGYARPLEDTVAIHCNAVKCFAVL